MCIRDRVKGFEVKNLKGTDSYLYLEQILLSNDKPPMARIEFEMKTNSGVKRKTRKFTVKENLFDISKGMQQYKGCLLYTSHLKTKTENLK